MDWMEAMGDKRFLEREIALWKRSPEREAQLDGERYYLGMQDILDKRRTVLGENGLPQEVDNLPNSRLTDNLYARMVDQKVNYLLGRPLTFETEDPGHGAALRELLGGSFFRLLRRLGEDALNGGVGWLYAGVGEGGELALRRFAPHQILPFWRDEAHTALDAAVRVYEAEVYEGQRRRVEERAELYTPEGVRRYRLRNGALTPEEEFFLPGATLGGAPLAWEKLPLIPFRSGSRETPLICRVKALQDALNTILSAFEDGMLEDPRNTILVLLNYDGENLGEFRRNLAAYGAVKLRTVDGAPGDLRTLSMEVNGDNYQAILKLLKKALVENARGFDARDERMTGNPNEMNLRSVYADIDLDANAMETEFQAALEELLRLADQWLSNAGRGDFSGDRVRVVFSRDALVNTGELISNLVTLRGLVSDRTLLAQVPFVTDVDRELAERKI